MRDHITGRWRRETAAPRDVTSRSAILTAMPLWRFVFLCLSVPAAWGVTTYYAFGLLERRRAPSSDDDDDHRPPIDYTI